MHMDQTPTKVLVVDDDDQDLDYVAGKIATWGYEVRKATDGAEAIAVCGTYHPDIVVSDLRMPRMDGLEMLKQLRGLGQDPPVILLTQFGSIDLALTAVHRAGAFWFLEKPVSMDVMRILVERAAEQNRLQAENGRLREVLSLQAYGDLVGEHPKMQRVFMMIRQVAPTSATVLITGESGTGKELVARAIHNASPRRDAPLVAVNCAALPDTLLESEMFGHERGAFTGAIERRFGRIELANGGTLFLDELCELPITMQAKLLRVLEDSRVRRIGSRTEMQVDVRVVAATNHDPLEAIQSGTLREDLYYRLNVFRIELPPLRERLSDLALLTHALLSSLRQRHQFAGMHVDSEILERFERYDWPGNVRELRNVLERAVILARNGPITMAHLPRPLGSDAPEHFQKPTVDDNSVRIRLGSSLEQAERAIILSTLEYAKNSRRKTAEILGLSLKTIHTKLKSYRLKANAGG